MPPKKQSGTRKAQKDGGQKRPNYHSRPRISQKDGGKQRPASHTGKPISGAKKKPAGTKQLEIAMPTLLTAALCKIPCHPHQPVIDFSFRSYQDILDDPDICVKVMSTKGMESMVGTLETEIEVGTSHREDENCFVVHVPDYLQEPEAKWSCDQLALVQDLHRMDQSTACDVEMLKHLDTTPEDMRKVLTAPCIGCQWLTVAELKIYTRPEVAGKEHSPNVFAALSTRSCPHSSTALSIPLSMPGQTSAPTRTSASDDQSRQPTKHRINIRGACTDHRDS